MSTYDPNTPWGACLQELDKLQAVITDITTGLEATTGAFPLEALRRIRNKANLVSRESDTAAQYLEGARGALDAGAATLEDTTAIISPEHEDYRQVPDMMANADLELGEAMAREVAVKEIAALGSAALGGIGQQMDTQKAAVEQAEIDFLRVTEVIMLMRGVIS